MVDPAARDDLTRAVIDALVRARRGSSVSLRGSLASGAADAWSDIDLLWTLPSADLAGIARELPEILQQVAPLGSLRWDPEGWMAADRRLAFARFDGVPLFWRVDIEVVGDPPATVMSQEPMPTWSLEESALMNGVAAVKASLRGKDEEAFALLERAFARLGVTQSAGTIADQVRHLAFEAGRLDPRIEELSAELARLVEEHLDP